MSAAVLYAFVTLACLAGYTTASRHQQREWHRRAWLAIGGIFAALIVSRVLGLEEFVRTSLRQYIREEGLFEGRREFQGAIIAVSIVLSAACGLATVYWISKRISGRRNICVAVAICACFAMVAIIAMRMISLHAMDQLLYGPLKLNWVGDIGASLVILACTAYYTKFVKRHLPRKRP